MAELFFQSYCPFFIAARFIGKCQSKHAQQNDPAPIFCRHQVAHSEAQCLQDFSSTNLTQLAHVNIRTLCIPFLTNKIQLNIELRDYSHSKVVHYDAAAECL